MPQIGIQAVDVGFIVSIDGILVRVCADEMDAHHWAKHAFEAVSGGARSVNAVAYAMERICLKATRFNLHRHHFATHPNGFAQRSFGPFSGQT
jgi:hypothetical protein